MVRKNRWALLEHSGASDDPTGIHFDFLLEDKDGCRTWRIQKIPILDGPSEEAIPLPLHRLEWLEISAGEVSRGRGWVRQVTAGVFSGELPDNDVDPVHIQLHSQQIKGNLKIKNSLCKHCSLSISDSN
mgnify:CR=1 FL=1